MSEKTRQRRLIVQYRLEELNRKYGPVNETEPEGIDCDPTWGPVGSLAPPLPGKAPADESDDTALLYDGTGPNLGEAGPAA